MASATAPYKFARIASLFLSFAFGFVALALGIDALIKGNREKDHIRSLAPQGAEVNIDTHDVETAGGVVSGFSAALGVISLLSLVFLVLTSFGARREPALKLQGLLLSIVTLGLFGSLVTMTDFVANREANVTASISGVPIPPSIVHSLEQSLGAQSVYREIPYIRTAAIVPWFTLLFGLTSSVLTLLAASSSRARASDAPAHHLDTASNDAGAGHVDEKKANVSVGQTRV
ncbi:hypothetical protein C8Q80DRAFT_1271546 [Daedaleopsis nitida]|nr:hypothetical protein C8Q80DRAFT_1271546 [Daedaleopsis nitida]